MIKTEWTQNQSIQFGKEICHKYESITYKLFNAQTTENLLFTVVVFCRFPDVNIVFLMVSKGS